MHIVSRGNLLELCLNDGCFCGFFASVYQLGDQGSLYEMRKFVYARTGNFR